MTRKMIKQKWRSPIKDPEGEGCRRDRASVRKILCPDRGADGCTCGGKTLRGQLECFPGQRTSILQGSPSLHLSTLLIDLFHLGELCPDQGSYHHYCGGVEMKIIIIPRPDSCPHRPSSANRRI